MGYNADRHRMEEGDPVGEDQRGEPQINVILILSKGGRGTHLGPRGSRKAQSLGGRRAEVGHLCGARMEGVGQLTEETRLARYHQRTFAVVTHHHHVNMGWGWEQKAKMYREGSSSETKKENLVSAAPLSLREERYSERTGRRRRGPQT